MKIILSTIRLLGLTLFAALFPTFSTYSLAQWAIESTFYKHEVTNKTDGDITAVFRYLTCRGDTLQLAPGQKGVVYAKHCCLNQDVEIFKHNGTIALDQQGNIAKRSNGRLVNYTTFRPKNTGASLSCTSNSIIVQDGPDGIVAVKG